MFLNHQHLGTDAAQRVTMVQTYLALIESDKLPKDEDRKLILQSLFRPGSDGIVKDDDSEPTARRTYQSEVTPLSPSLVEQRLRTNFEICWVDFRFGPKAEVCHHQHPPPPHPRTISNPRPRVRAFYHAACSNISRRSSSPPQGAACWTSPNACSNRSRPAESPAVSPISFCAYLGQPADCSHVERPWTGETMTDPTVRRDSISRCASRI